MTERRSEGGKAPRPAGARGILEAGEAFGDEALAPLADGVTVAPQIGSDALIRRGVGLGGEQDDAATEDEGLGGGTGADEVFELDAHFGSQLDRRAKGTWHGNPPGEQEKVILVELSWQQTPRLARRLAANL